MKLNSSFGQKYYYMTQFCKYFPNDKSLCLSFCFFFLFCCFLGLNTLYKIEMKMESSIKHIDHQHLILLFIERTLFSPLNLSSCRAVKLDLTEISILFFESTNIVLPSSIIRISREKSHFQKRQNSQYLIFLLMCTTKKRFATAILRFLNPLM